MSNLTFNWKHETQPNEVYRLYENGKMIVDNIGQLSFSIDTTGYEEQEYHFYLTTYNTMTKMESVPSAAVSINFIKPLPPVITGWLVD